MRTLSLLLCVAALSSACTSSSNENQTTSDAGSTRDATSLDALADSTTAAPGDDGSLGDASTPATACEAAVKCWTFEDGVLPGDLYEDIVGHIPPMVDNVHAYESKYALHVEGTIGESPQIELQTVLPADFGATMWGRAFIYTTPSGPANHGGVIRGTFDDGNWYEVGYDLGDYLTIWHPPYPPGYPELVFQTTTPVVSNDWACVEWEFDGANAANPRVFVNSVEQIPEDPFIYPDGSAMPQVETSFHIFALGFVMYHDLPVRTDLWFDDVAVGKTRIGCAP